jgi:hypothetical protein
MMRAYPRALQHRQRHLGPLDWLELGVIKSRYRVIERPPPVLSKPRDLYGSRGSLD